MKITKTQLRNIIKEEATQALSEVEYDEHGPMYVQPVEGKTTPDDAEVLLQGYGGLRIDQIRSKLLGMLQEAAQDDSLATFNSFVRNGVMMRLYETLVEHSALSPDGSP
tara:strand:- start:30 stop:356 length:327 start_codon:yes stop_codon:yes gene_type:complete